MSKEAMSVGILILIIQIILLLVGYSRSKSWRSYGVWFDKSDDILLQMNIVILVLEGLLVSSIGIYKLIYWIL